MSQQGTAALQVMKEQRQIERIHAIYNQFIGQLNQLDSEQNKVIKQILEQIDHANIKKILSTIHND